MGGFNDGFVRKLNRANRSIDSTTAIAALIATPFIHYSEPVIMKMIHGASVGISPKGDYNLAFRWRRDDNPQQSVNITQGGGDFLGTVATNQFTLGTSQLAGSSLVDRYTELGEEGGEFRTIQYELANSGVDEDLELHSISTDIKPSSKSYEN